MTIDGSITSVQDKFSKKYQEVKETLQLIGQLVEEHKGEREQLNELKQQEIRNLEQKVLERFEQEAVQRKEMEKRVVAMVEQRVAQLR